MAAWLLLPKMTVTLSVTFLDANTVRYCSFCIKTITSEKKSYKKQGRKEGRMEVKKKGRKGSR